MATNPRTCIFGAGSGLNLEIAPGRVRFATVAEAAAGPQLVLVTVKSADTDAAACSLARVLGAPTPSS